VVLLGWIDSRHLIKGGASSQSTKYLRPGAWRLSQDRVLIGFNLATQLASCERIDSKPSRLMGFLWNAVILFLGFCTVSCDFNVTLTFPPLACTFWASWYTSLHRD